MDTEKDAAPRFLEVDMLAAHDAVSTDSRKAQRKVGRLLNRGRHAARTASLNQVSETARLPRLHGPLGGIKTRDFVKVRDRSLQGAGGTACLRERPVDVL